MSVIGKKGENSGVNLLKIFAMIMIVVSSLSCSFSLPRTDLPIDSSYFINASVATANLNNFIILLIDHLVMVGIDILFICLAKSFIGNVKISSKKAVNMLLDVWIISVVLLAVVYFAKSAQIHRVGQIKISTQDIVKSFLPNSLCANQFVSAYILFYIISPAINMIIGKLSKRQHFITVIVLLFIYSFVNSIREGAFYSSLPVRFIMLYFLLCYLEKYKQDLMNDIKLNVLLLISSLVLMGALIAAMNYLELKHNLTYSMLKYDISEFPLIILINVIFKLLYIQAIIVFIRFYK